VFRTPLIYSTLVSGKGDRHLASESFIRKLCKCKRNCYLTVGLFSDCGGARCYSGEMERWVKNDVVAEDMKEHHRNNEVITGCSCVNIASRVLGIKRGSYLKFQRRGFYLELILTYLVHGAGVLLRS